VTLVLRGAARHVVRDLQGRPIQLLTPTALVLLASANFLDDPRIEQIS